MLTWKKVGPYDTLTGLVAQGKDISVTLYQTGRGYTYSCPELGLGLKCVDNDKDVEFVKGLVENSIRDRLVSMASDIIKNMEELENVQKIKEWETYVNRVQLPA